MKKFVFICLFVHVFILLKAQHTEYQTFIYTSDDLSKEIALQCEDQRTRGYLGELFNAGKESVKGITSGYITSAIDLSVNAIASLITRNSRLKQEWEKMVLAENVYETRISTVSELNDFYKEKSFESAMDPKGMQFDGIGCLRKENNDTVFYISCHIDRSKINRIINHSKFELILDTLIISPLHSNLPNTPLDLPFSFEERRNFNLSVDIKLISSWINHITQLQRDQLLGRFRINIPVAQSSLDEKGFLRYVREEGAIDKYEIIGESFIVPRSFIGYRDENDEYRNCWGTGQYELTVELKETCTVTDKYRENWKKDLKRRKKLQSREKFIDTTWQMISSQRWDELSKSWVITTLQAPAKIITEDVIKMLGLEQMNKTTE